MMQSNLSQGARVTDSDMEFGDGMASRLGVSIEVLDSLVPRPIEEVTVDNAPPARWFAAGDPYLVLIGLGEGITYVGEPVVTWRGAHSPQLGVLGVTELPAGDAPDDAATGATRLIELMKTRRAARFRRCDECGRSTPPEWLHSAALCDGCAERNHGVVH